MATVAEAAAVWSRPVGRASARPGLAPASPSGSRQQRRRWNRNLFRTLAEARACNFRSSAQSAGSVPRPFASFFSDEQQQAMRTRPAKEEKNSKRLM